MKEIRDILADPSTLGWWVALALLAVLVAWRLKVRLSKWWEDRRRRKRQERAGKAEVAAARLLEKTGYEVLDTQVRRQWEIDVDGELLEVTVIADYVVEKDGETLVAEVKSGEQAPELTNAATRRQLLEYALAYDSPTIVLVDMTELAIRRVRIGIAPSQIEEVEHRGRNRHEDKR
jgi:Holliday junction resolvase-like predicted endonuclease